MSANPPLQARAGRNSPLQSLAPDFTDLIGFLVRLGAVAAPGVDVKIAEGGKGLISPAGLRAFMGDNVGAAAITLTATLRRDSDGAVFATDTGALGPGPNSQANFNIAEFLPEGFSLWLNATLTAGVYGGDAEAQYQLAKSRLLNEGPKDLSTTLETVVAVDDGHAKLLGTFSFPLFNRDSVPHGFLVFLSNALGDTRINAGSMLAGATANFLPPTMLNSGESIKVQLTEPIVTPGTSVTAMGICVESNLLNE